MQSLANKINWQHRASCRFKVASTVESLRKTSRFCWVLTSTVFDVFWPKRLQFSHLRTLLQGATCLWQPHNNICITAEVWWTSNKDVVWINMCTNFQNKSIFDDSRREQYLVVWTSLHVDSSLPLFTLTTIKEQLIVEKLTLRAKSELDNEMNFKAYFTL